MTDQPRVQLRCPDPLRAAITAALSTGGLSPTVPASEQGAAADVGLVVADRRPRPALTDDWLVDSFPHLALVVTPTDLRVGPFVVPGTTACLRCLEASGMETGMETGMAAGMKEPAVLAGVPAGKPDGVADGGAPTPDRVLLAGALAVAELTRWLGGQLPRTCSATLHVDAELATWHRRWRRHPWCGCGWGESLLRA